jgi:hypothetical protein
MQEGQSRHDFGLDHADRSPLGRPRSRPQAVSRPLLQWLCSMVIDVHIHHECAQRRGRLTRLAEWAAILTLVVAVLTLAWTVLSTEPKVVKVEPAPGVQHHARRHRLRQLPRPHQAVVSPRVPKCPVTGIRGRSSSSRRFLRPDGL